MPVQKFTARVSDVQQITEKFVYVHAELLEPHRLEFSGGQYILLEVPGTPKKKSYSIASEPAMDHALELLVDITPKGEGTSYIASLKPGDTISFYAPAGMFVMPDPATELGQEEKALVFVATGSGITSLRSMILDQLQNKHDQRQMVLYWGLRHEQDIYWLDEFRELERAFPNFRLHLVLSRAGEEWPLCRGRVTDCLQVHPMLSSAGYYLCGNKAMIDEVHALLATRGVKPEHVHNEQYY